MNDQEHVITEFEQDEFEEVARQIGPDGEDLGRVRIRLEVHDHECVVEGMPDVGLGGTVTEGRAVNVHTLLSYYDYPFLGTPRLPGPTGH